METSIVSFPEETGKNLQNFNDGAQPSHCFCMMHSYIHMAATDSSEFWSFNKNEAAQN